jgi:hypothetical protein
MPDPHFAVLNISVRSIVAGAFGRSACDALEELLEGLDSGRDKEQELQQQELQRAIQERELFSGAWTGYE